MNGVREDIRFLSQRLKHFVYGVGSAPLKPSSSKGTYQISSQQNWSKNKTGLNGAPSSE